MPNLNRVTAPRLLALAVLAALAALAAACVSTGGRPPPEVSRKEAAKFNMQLGISYLRQGDFKTAQEKLEKAVREDNSLATAFSALGLVYERLGDLPAAEKNYRRGASLAPSDPDTLNALGAFLCVQRAQPEEALRYFDKALAVPLSRADTNRAMLFTNAGLCAKRIDLEAAEKYLRQALAVDPQFADALLQLADVSYSRENYLQARAFLQRFMAARSATPDALWLGYRVEKALGQAEEAENYGERLKKEFPESTQTGLLLASQRDAR